MAEGNGTNGTNGNARLGVYASVAGVVLVVLGTLFVLYAQVNSAYTTANDLKERVDRLSDTINAQRTQITQICASLVEVETQFRASDQVRNLMHTNDLRIQAMLWRKTFAADYPVGDPYLPTIAQEQPTPCR